MSPGAQQIEPGHSNYAACSNRAGEAPVQAWRLRKKTVESAKASKIIEKKVVEYEREIRDDSVNKNDRSHLTNKNFIDAMALLSEDINE